jgi:hypothetical protein
MRANRIVAALVLPLSCTLFAPSCVQGPDPERYETQGQPDAGPTTNGEPTGEAQEPIATVRYSPEDFPFVTIVKDDGKGKAGGWQQAKAKLDFAQGNSIEHREWQCTLTIGMPLRTAVAGPIPPKHASELSARLAAEAARGIEPAWELPPSFFCRDFVKAVERQFKSKHPLLGATVTR